MKRKLTLLLAVALLASGLFTTGCTSTNRISPATVHQGVAAGVAYSSAKYTNAVPYLRMAVPVICAAANGTNLAPAEVVKAIEGANISLKTPEAVLILNAALMFYTGIWDSYGEDALNKAPELRPYLEATCSGITAGLPSIIGLMRAAPDGKWPLVKFP